MRSGSRQLIDSGDRATKGRGEITRRGRQLEQAVDFLDGDKSALQQGHWSGVAREEAPAGEKKIESGGGNRWEGI